MSKYNKPTEALTFFHYWKHFNNYAVKFHSLSVYVSCFMFGYNIAKSNSIEQFQLKVKTFNIFLNVFQVNFGDIK